MTGTNPPSPCTLLYLQGAPVATVVDEAILRCGADGSSRVSRFLADTVFHPVGREFPLRPGYNAALLKRYMAQIASSPLADEDESHAFAADELQLLEEAYAECLVTSGHHRVADIRDESSFVSYYCRPAARKEDSCGSSSSHPFPVVSERCSDSSPGTLRHSRDDGDNDQDIWVHVQVGAHFVNVGMSLWPSAFVLTHVLCGELDRLFGRGLESGSEAVSKLLAPQLLRPPRLVDDAIDTRRRWNRASRASVRVVELGAGVGLTSLFLTKNAASARWPNLGSVDVVLTDYQEVILQNTQRNLARLKRASSPRSESAVVSTSSCPADEGSPVTAVTTTVELLDWTEHDTRRQQLQWRTWNADVILAADCIYDVSVVGDLVSTIHSALLHATAAGVASSCNKEDDDGATGTSRSAQEKAGAITPTHSNVENSESVHCCWEPCAIVVQTHRQASTMQIFFDALRRAQLCCESFQCDFTHPSHDFSTSTVTLVPAAPPLTFDKCDTRLSADKAAVNVDSLLQSRWVGPFWVDMAELIGVHRITLPRNNVLMTAS